MKLKKIIIVTILVIAGFATLGYFLERQEKEDALRLEEIKAKNNTNQAVADTTAIDTTTASF